MTWREHFQPIISAVIREVGTSNMRFLRKQLRASWPYPPHGHYPYRVWLQEIRRQLRLGPKNLRKKRIMQLCLWEEETEGKNGYIAGTDPAARDKGADHYDTMEPSYRPIGPAIGSSLSGRSCATQRPHYQDKGNALTN